MYPRSLECAWRVNLWPQSDEKYYDVLGSLLWKLRWNFSFQLRSSHGDHLVTPTFLEVRKMWYLKKRAESTRSDLNLLKESRVPSHSFRYQYCLTPAMSGALDNTYASCHSSSPAAHWRPEFFFSFFFGRFGAALIGVIFASFLLGRSYTVFDSFLDWLIFAATVSGLQAFIYFSERSDTLVIRTLVSLFVFGDTTHAHCLLLRLDLLSSSILYIRLWLAIRVRSFIFAKAFPMSTSIAVYHYLITNYGTPSALGTVVWYVPFFVLYLYAQHRRCRSLLVHISCLLSSVCCSSELSLHLGRSYNQRMYYLTATFCWTCLSICGFCF